MRLGNLSNKFNPVRAVLAAAVLVLTGCVTAGGAPPVKTPVAPEDANMDFSATNIPVRSILKWSNGNTVYEEAHFTYGELEHLLYPGGGFYRYDEDSFQTRSEQMFDGPENIVQGPTYEEMAIGKVWYSVGWRVVGGDGEPGVRMPCVFVKVGRGNVSQHRRGIVDEERITGTYCDPDVDPTKQADRLVEAIRAMKMRDDAG